MIAKKLVPLIVFAIIALLIVPQYVSATSYSSNSTIMEMDSEHADNYDELVNVANNSALQNSATWSPAPQGIWIGGSTKESSLRLAPIFTTTDRVVLSWEFSLASSQIMSGVGSWTLRFPFDTTGVSSWTFNLYQIPYSKCYYSEVNGTTARLNFTTPIYEIFNDDSGSYNSAYSDGDNYWVASTRPYLRVNAPIIPGNLYLAKWIITPSVDGRIIVYVSPNDVCSDENLNSTASWSAVIAPLTYSFSSTNLSLDMGCSFDMRAGLGNGAMYAEHHFYIGNTFWFWTYANVGGTNVYHTINLPIYSLNGTSRWEIQVYDAISVGLLWSTAATTYYGSLVQCSPATVDLSGDPSVRFLIVMMMSSWDQTIRFALGDKPNVDDGGILTRQYNVQGNVTEYLGGMGWGYNLGPVMTYHISSMAIPTPDLNPNNPWPQLQAMTQRDSNDDIWVFLINLAISIGTASPLPFLIHDKAGDTIGDMVFKNLRNIANFGMGIYDRVMGMIRNTIDAVWATLVAIGDFIWSVGEWLYDAIVWLADAVMEFGAMILGLLVVFVIVIIFFFCIWFQLKIYGIFLRLAQGDTKGALKEGQQLASTIEKVV